MVLALLALFCAAAFAQRPEASLDALQQGQVLNGFETRAVYVNDDGHAMGARFVHRRTGFTLDMLRVESVPQGFIWVTTYPTSNNGEPHTQEHLLLGKGNMGRAVASVESMSLAASSAFTQQWRTCYHF
jgi:Zn-dependent M16 (insulinase) family peptidase